MSIIPLNIFLEFNLTHQIEKNVNYCVKGDSTQFSQKCRVNDPPCIKGQGSLRKNPISRGPEGFQGVSTDEVKEKSKYHGSPWKEDLFLNTTLRHVTAYPELSCFCATFTDNIISLSTTVLDRCQSRSDPSISRGSRAYFLGLSLVLVTIFERNIEYIASETL